MYNENETQIYLIIILFMPKRNTSYAPRLKSSLKLDPTTEFAKVVQIIALENDSFGSSVQQLN